MLEALLSFLIMVIVICIVAGIVLWAVGHFFPEAYQPARLIVGGIALIAILMALYRVVTGGGPVLGMP